MRVKPVILLRVIKVLGEVSGIWPIFDSQVSIRVIKELVWFVSIVNITLIIIPTILRIHKDINENQPLNALHSLSALPVYSETFVNLIIWKYNKSQIQGLLVEMFDHIKSVNGRDKNILSKSINHHLPLYIFVVVFCTIACVSHLSVPIFTPKKLLPSIAYYPFSIEQYTTTYYLVYTQQAIANLQCGLHHTVPPIIIAILLSYVTVKLKVLSLALKNVDNVDQFNNWIRQHRDCIR
ncbi:uncharacterized protein LOC103569723 [Microplitis demolitor]|uniref:uncharacterized protein LOC103569723 n=1 Tax=Microplitis demolitor TaxID=69319 RepID=UPI0004CCDD9E|nr:uncharacterized protein LOC103569723 [Microplitis demolitor]